MEKTKIDSFAAYQLPSQLTLSPDENYLCYVVSQADVEKNCYNQHLHLYDRQSGRFFQLTNGRTGEQQPVFLDQEHILFCSDRQDKANEQDRLPWTEIYSISIRGGEASLWAKLPLSVSAYAVLGEAQLLLLADYDPRYGAETNLADPQFRGTISETLKKEADYEVLDEIPFWADGGDFIRGHRTRLYLYDQKQARLTPLTDEKTDCQYLALNRAKTQALVVTARYESKLTLHTQLRLLDLQDLSLKNLLETDPSFDDATIYAAEFWQDAVIFVAADRKQYGLNQDPDIYYLPLDAVTPARKLAGDNELQLGNSVGSDLRRGQTRFLETGADYCRFVVTRPDHACLLSLDHSGKLQVLTAPDQTVEDFVSLKDGGCIYIAFSGREPAALYQLDAGKTIQPLPEALAIPPQLSRAKLERFTFKWQTDTLNAWVLLPPDYDPTVTYPGILMIHGGPKTIYGDILFHEMEFLTAQGYILFFTNPRGSDGCGRNWADIRGGYGQVEYQQLMALTDQVLSRYPALDARRLGVMGGSYGGFMTNWIIGHTSRFAAACSQRSISNMISMFGVSDIGFYFIPDQCGQDPWTDAAELWRQSPLAYAPAVTTPTLFLHSDHDYRCPLPEGIQMYNALKYLGVPARLVIFKGESHGLSRGGKPQHRIRRLQEISAWFDRYLKSGATPAAT
ncbi:S9 family peptidase [Oscillospiraceae bacterium HV4-5-C5C]|nr:S9 family peptidase [Oscillospiraceae bacterium HV4-5-C5C]